MSLCRQISFSPMSDNDLDWVSTHECRLHAFPWSRGNFADAMNAGYGCWVMREDDRPVAYGIVLFVLDEAHLLNISVIADAQGRGLGSTLMHYLFARARENGARSFFLEVRPSNNVARALYARQGFTEIGRRRAYYPAADGREDAIVMKVDL